MSRAEHRPLFTISRKIAVGYLLMAFFSLVSIAAALSGLHQQTLLSQRLVAVEFESLNRLRDLREHLLAQETLEKQYLILQDHSLLELLLLYYQLQVCQQSLTDSLILPSATHHVC